MADASMGPVATMPGTLSQSTEGALCDNHPDAPAVRRLQGETDSMGCEYHDLCEVCLAAYRAEARQARVGNCDWCKNQADDLRPRRDFEEGLAGRLYDVCGDCVRRQNDALRAELDDGEEFGDDGDGWI